MPILAVCPYCQEGKVRAPDSAVGLSADCPRCHNSFTLVASTGRMKEHARSRVSLPPPPPQVTIIAPDPPDEAVAEEEMTTEADLPDPALPLVEPTPVFAKPPRRRPHPVLAPALAPALV